MIAFLSKELSRVLSSTTIRKHQFFGAQPSCNSHPHMTAGKNMTICTFVSKVTSLLSNTLFRFVIAFLDPKLWLSSTNIFEYLFCVLFKTTWREGRRKGGKQGERNRGGRKKEREGANEEETAQRY